MREKEKVKTFHVFYMMAFPSRISTGIPICNTFNVLTGMKMVLQQYIIDKMIHNETMLIHPMKDYHS